MKSFIVNKKVPSDRLVYYNDTDTIMHLDLDTIKTAILNTNEDIRNQYNDAKKYPAAILVNIPLKNVSGAIGECLGQHIALLTKNIIKNPHESGTPDFIPIVPKSKPWIDNPTREYYSFGGFDTKASFCEHREFMRVGASSHHNQTSTVLVVQWAYDADKIPEVIGVYYTNQLTSDDWKISRGRVGSKTTNAAALTASGKDKLRNGWLVLSDTVKLPRNNKRNGYGF